MDARPSDAGVALAPDVMIREGGAVASVACPVFAAWQCGAGEVPPSPCCALQAPPCTPTDLRGQTCSGQGFAGGTLTCGAWCNFDTTGCDPCAQDPHIAACGRAPVDARSPAALALAATDAEIVAAWTTSDEVSGASALHVARFAPDLTLIADLGCIDVPNPRHVALAAVGAGWLIAVEDAAGVDVIPLDANATPRGPVHTIAGAETPLLAAQPGASVLLGWGEQGGDYYDVAIVAADGSAQTAPTHVFGPTIEADLGSAVFTGDAFLVAQRTSAGITLARVALDGTAGAPVQPIDDTSEFPQLGWTGTEAQMTFGDFGASLATMIVRLDSTGHLASPAQPLGVPGYHFYCPVLAAGTDVLVLVASVGAPDGVNAAALEVTRHAPDNSVVVPAFSLTRDPGPIEEWRFVLRGTDAIAGWIDRAYPGGLQLARMAP